MSKLKFKEKINKPGNPIEIGQVITLDGDKLVGFNTKSLYIRKGRINGTLFLSEKGHGGTGSGDICPINKEIQLEVSSNLFCRILDLAKKANAI